MSFISLSCFWMCVRLRIVEGAISKCSRNTALKKHMKIARGQYFTQAVKTTTFKDLQPAHKFPNSEISLAVRLGAS